MEVVFLVGSMTTDRTIDQHTESSYVLEPEGSERGLERVCVMSPRDESRVYVHVCTALYSLYCLLRHPSRKRRSMTYTYNNSSFSSSAADSSACWSAGGFSRFCQVIGPAVVHTTLEAPAHRRYQRFRDNSRDRTLSQFYALNWPRRNNG